MAVYRWIDDDLFTVERLFTEAECEALIAFAEGIGFADAPITTAFGPMRAPRVRNNTRVMVEDAARAAELFERIRDFLPAAPAGFEATGANERIRFYRYDPGQRFEWHTDGCFQRSIDERSRLTYMVYLNGGFEGGQTELDLDGRAVSIEPTAGLGIVFAHPLRHRGAPVTAGRSYVLRTDIMYRRVGAASEAPTA